MTTISSDARDAEEVVMSSLDAFHSAVQLTRVQLKELLARASGLKHGPPELSPFPAASARPGQFERELIGLRHPVHVLADLLTMRERAGVVFEQIAFCCTGDGASALAESLMLAGTALGMDVRIGCPAKYAPTESAVAQAHHLAAASQAGLLLTTNNARATQGAHFVVTVPFGRLVATTITETAMLAHRPPAIRPLAEEQAVNRLWVLEAVLADWLAEAEGAWAPAAGS